MAGNKMLSQNVADNIMSMITIEKRFEAGSKLPNELELAGELNVSRTTLREAVRILVAYGVLEVRRGTGTFVTEKAFHREEAFGQLTDVMANARDLYEMRLIFEPEAAYLAAVRGTDGELKRIAECGRGVEEAIRDGRDRTEQERAFHKSIAQATHNEFMNKLMPILYQAISKGVALSEQGGQAVQDTVNDHRLIVEFLSQRNAEGARSAMKIHIHHAIRELGLGESAPSAFCKSSFL
ncbi:MAG: FadR family transcriptional regulator [Clostridium sp.]|nr:FadR family transcriptional regulator [Clostridium sp.]